MFFDIDCCRIPKFHSAQINMLAATRESENDLHAMSVAFSKYCKEKLNTELGEDFLELSASAMSKLKAGNRSNVLYNLAKGVGTNRMDESESRFPVTRMPMGLVEYTIFFKQETAYNNLGCAW